MNFYEAFAFCIWDEARLPTPEEWDYAATGGDEHRAYPWGQTPVPDETNADFAVYDCLADGDPTCAPTDIVHVGSRPLGIGRWGQLDLAGSMAEWNFGWEPYYGPDSHTGTSPIQKGSWQSRAAFLAAYTHNITYSTFRTNTWGVRCARAVR